MISLYFFSIFLIWYLASDHLQQRTAKGPYIGFVTELAIQLLWTHVPLCSAHGFFGVQRWIDLIANAKVDKFDCFKVFWKGYIFRFEILMNNMIIMKVLQAMHYLSRYRFYFVDVCFSTFTFNIAQEIASFHLL